jgi:hypothetical protein
MGLEVRYVGYLNAINIESLRRQLVKVECHLDVFILTLRTDPEKDAIEWLSSMQLHWMYVKNVELLVSVSLQDEANIDSPDIDTVSVVYLSFE